MSQYIPVIGIHDDLRDCDLESDNRGVSIVYDPEDPDNASTFSYQLRTPGSNLSPR